MNKKVIIVLLLMLLSISLYGQGFYTDIETGYGAGDVFVEGKRIGTFLESGQELTYHLIDVSVRIGYGFLDEFTLYALLGIYKTGYYYENKEYITIALYSAMPEIMLYLFEHIQVSIFSGFTYGLLNSNVEELKKKEDMYGISYGGSIGYDIGIGSAGLIIGAKYVQTIVFIKGGMGRLQKISIYLKCAYRTK